MLFDKIRKTRQPENPPVEQIFDRLQSMRRQVGHREVPVADLFGLVGHDEARVRWPQQAPPARVQEPVRVRPEDVPSQKNYVTWE